METRTASAFSDARESRALRTASCELSPDCARHSGGTRSTRNNNDAKMRNPCPGTLTGVFTDLLSLGRQIINAVVAERLQRFPLAHPGLRSCHLFDRWRRHHSSIVPHTIQGTFGTVRRPYRTSGLPSATQPKVVSSFL